MALRESTAQVSADPYRAYRPWFYAAAAYNVIWGGLVILFPSLVFQLSGMNPLNYPSVFQGVGMMVAVYALGYYYIAKDPERYGNLVWIGLLGKTFGPIGFVYGYLTSELPLGFAWVFLFNDLIWWPAFWSFALKHARRPFN